MSEAPADELFYERMRRVERDNRELVRLLGEKDCEIARLRKALQAIAAECESRAHCVAMGKIREMATMVMENEQN